MMIRESGQNVKTSIFLFYGEEEFLVEEKIKALKDRVGGSSLNIEVLEGDSVTEESLCSALQTQTLLGGDKLVIIRDLKISAENQELYLSLLKELPPGVTVVLQASAVDQRSKFYRFVSDRGEVVECRSFAPWEQDRLVNWIKLRVGEGGKRISDGTARLFQEISGNNLRLLASDIEKIITFIGGREEMSDEDILALASPGQKSVFDLLDALREKNLKRSLTILQILLRNKEDMFQLLSTLASQYRLMLQIKSLPSGTAKDPRSIAGVVKGNPFFVKKCLERIGNFNPAELKRSLELILETNLKLKTGQAQAVVFELMLASLCGS